MSSNPILDPRNPLHLYRHILREISYLPPPVRPWTAARAADRFRSRPWVCEPVLRRRLYVAHGALWRLRAANAGDPGRMRDILLRAFGRRGRRRRELVSMLAYREGRAVADTASLQSLLDGAPARRRDDALAALVRQHEGKSPLFPLDIELPSRRSLRWAWLDKWDLDGLKAYLNSQRAQQRRVTTAWPQRLLVRTTDPAASIPALNYWQRPWHPKTYRTKLAKAWRAVAEKIQPPLPRGEWELLRKVALNEADAKEWRVPKKRAPAAPSGVPPERLRRAEARDGTEETVPANQQATGTAAPELSGEQEGGGEFATWNWKEYATKPVRHIERARAPRNLRLSGQTDRGPYGREVRHPPVRGDGRWIRRLFGAVWQASSVLEQDPTTLKSKVTWGQKTYAPVTMVPLQGELLSGVNARGKRLK